MRLQRKLMIKGIMLLGIMVSGVIGKEILDQLEKLGLSGSDQLYEEGESLYEVTCKEIDRKTRYLYEDR